MILNYFIWDELKRNKKTGSHNPEVVGSSPASASIKIPGIHYEYRDFSNFFTWHENSPNTILEQLWNS